MIPIVLQNDGGKERSFDIYSRLLRDRIIMCHGEIEDNMATLIVAQLLFLQSEDNNKPIHLYINSPGGVCTAGLSIVDTINILKCPVYTYCMGQCASMGAVLLSCGEKGKRFILPHARVMIHQASFGARGQIEDVRRTFEEGNRINEMLLKILAKNCDKTEEELKKDMDRDCWLSSEDSVKYGIVDNILTK